MASDDKNAKRRKELKAKTEELKRGLKALEKAGYDVPRGLLKAVDRAETAAKTGKDIADAAQEVSDEIQSFKKTYVKACAKKYGGGSDAVGVCEAEFLRTFAPSDILRGVADRAIMKQFAEHLPEAVCKWWAFCARELRKKEKAEAR